MNLCNFQYYSIHYTKFSRTWQNLREGDTVLIEEELNNVAEVLAAGERYVGTSVELHLGLRWECCLSVLDNFFALIQVLKFGRENKSRT